MKPFDKEKIHDALIAPLMDQIIEICRDNKIPMLASFCYAKGREEDDPEGVCYCTTNLPVDGWQTPEFCEALRIIKTRAASRDQTFVAAVTIIKP